MKKSKINQNPNDPLHVASYNPYGYGRLLVTIATATSIIASHMRLPKKNPIL